MVLFCGALYMPPVARIDINNKEKAESWYSVGGPWFVLSYLSTGY